MRRTIIRSLSVLVVLSGVVAGGLALRWWIKYPHVPDVKKVNPNDSIAFMGTDDFNRMTQAHRKRYSMSLIDRLRDKNFSELVAIMMQRDEHRQKLSDNIKKIDKEDRDEIGSRFMQLFLDKFFEQTQAQRDAYLASIVALQKAGAATGRMKEMGLPKPEDLKKSLTDFLNRQPPRAQAQMSQFMLDLNKKQHAFGVSSGW